MRFFRFASCVFSAFLARVIAIGPQYALDFSVGAVVARHARPIEKDACMSFAEWLKSLVSTRGKTLSMYRNGMVKANRRDYKGAIADYSAAIESPEIPPDVKAMAIYNRALAYSAIHQDDKAADDLKTVLATPDLPDNIRTAAQQRRERIRRRGEEDANA